MNKDNDLMYTKSQATAQEVFESYVKASSGVYCWDDNKVKGFNRNHAYNNAGGPQLGVGQQCLEDIKQVIPREVFTKVSGHGLTGYRDSLCQKGVAIRRSGVI
ncbi:uncharacterized protein EI90DRAFT_3130643 [Cantharellus anzutake]|uniref:uncharacterized protein n=1 Tax=Cantharellus anzutake TaxID=1750568 RepID=UPI001908039A|nr:uncharacterized protein EI90DRAFT_3130643 [Cantharellus anzutake]KAF8322887.1 hypothetical protein EI90DRAFT_3130643 [Cantharellus anzutake]